jgi:ubiquinone/menaquinone biosynthesis C-methylase UbiE
MSKAIPGDAHIAGREAWDGTWQPHLNAEQLDFTSPTLENHIDQQKLRFLAADLPETGSAVEVGCGSARLLARVGSNAKLELVGVDASENALRLTAATAKRFGLSIRGIRGDARDLPLETASCSLVLSGGLLEHFEDPTTVLSEMLRILKPGGLFYADVVPRKFSLYRFGDAFRMLRSTSMLPGVYESSLGVGWYKRTLSELGFQAIRIESAGVYPHAGAVRWAARTSRWDGTKLADMLGWYFMISARKPS